MWYNHKQKGKTIEQSPLAKLAIFFSKYRRIHIKKKETLLRSGDVPSGVYFLRRGYIRLYALSRAGEELTLVIFKPEDFFPLIFAIHKLPALYYFEAMTSVELWQAPQDEFLAFIKTHPDVMFEITNRILIRFTGVLTRMEYLTFGNAYNKVASILIICAERFGKTLGNQTLIQVPMTHRDIATLIGITRETTSIEMKKLEKRGAFIYRGRHILVTNMKKLRQEAQLDATS